MAHELLTVDDQELAGHASITTPQLRLHLRPASQSLAIDSRSALQASAEPSTAHTAREHGGSKRKKRPTK